MVQSTPSVQPNGVAAQAQTPAAVAAVLPAALGGFDMASIGQLLSTLMETAGQWKMLTRKDDYSIVAEIAKRNPVALMPYTPDPLGGRFPDIFAQATINGIRVGLNAKGATLGPQTGTSPNPSVGPSGLVNGVLPGGSVTQSPTPATTTDPNPTPSGQGANRVPPWTIGDTSSIYDGLPDSALDQLQTDIAIARAKREIDQATISVTAP